MTETIFAAPFWMPALVLILAVALAAIFRSGPVLKAAAGVAVVAGAWLGLSLLVETNQEQPRHCRSG